MKPFAKLAAWPLSAAAFRPDPEKGKARSPFVVLGKSVRKKDAEGYDDATILLNAAEVPTVIALLQRLENDLFPRE